LKMIQLMLTNYPSVGIVHQESGQLVAWMLTYDDGAIGMLYVKKEHRRRGLARATVSLLLQKYYAEKSRCFGSSTSSIASDYEVGCPCFTYVVDENEPSLGLMTSLGFRRLQDCSWMGFKTDYD
jgi:GNAT superfamily N-acetyltransferase